jgi:hypothetical protein
MISFWFCMALYGISDFFVKIMTEEQKMEEGKRMFSIFAARMFEQRVLQAYRERVAQERQTQLLRELEDEDKMSKEKEAKKQSQNQKKKDKKRFVFLITHFPRSIITGCFLFQAAEAEAGRGEGC